MTIDRRSRIVAVTLHRVGPSTEIQPEYLELIFRVLVKKFKIVLPSEVNHLANKGRIATLMIDDGHQDSYQYIFPIAKAYSVPFGLCISTDYFFRNAWLWFDKINWVMNHIKPETSAVVDGLTVTYQEPYSVHILKQQLKRYPPAKRELAIEKMIKELGLDISKVPPDEYRALTRSELNEMLSSGLVEVVGHTVTHTIATVLEQDEFEAELRLSKTEWEAYLDRPLLSFCYPNGLQGDFSDCTKFVLQETGYINAFTSVEGTNLIRKTDPYEIRRIHIHTNPATFCKTISGLVDLQNSLGL